MRINIIESRIILVIYVTLFVLIINIFLDYDSYVPDGIMLQKYLCVSSLSLIHNGILYLPYQLLTDCSIEGPQLCVILLNYIFILLIISILTKWNMSLSKLIMIMLSLTFPLYTIFYPSKEILLSLVFLLAIATPNYINRYVYLTIYALIRPAYFPLLFFKYFSNKLRIFALVLIIYIITFALQNGYVPDYSELYIEKQSEYNGKATQIFEMLSDYSYLIRIIWNFIGIFGTLLTAYNFLDWHISMHIGTQISLLIIFILFVKISIKNKHFNNIDRIFILFVILTATWPSPHTRYLYPMIFGFIYHYL